MERFHRLLDLGELFTLYGIKLERRRALCPWHGGEKPLLAVDSVKGRYRCYGQGCRHHGDHLDFLEQYVGLKREEALAELERLSRQSNLTLPEGYTGPRRVR